MGRELNLYRQEMDPERFEELREEILKDYDLEEGIDYNLGETPQNPKLVMSSDDPVLEVDFVGSDLVVTHYGEEDVIEALESLE